jgi:hypothetical protein
VVRVFLLAFLAYAYFMPRWADWNIDSRVDLVHAIVDHQTLQIDRYHWNTWDKAVFGGHYYSDKAPGTAVLGAFVYGTFKLVRSLPVSGDVIRGLESNSAWGVALALGRTHTQLSPAPAGRILGGCQRSGLKGNVQYIPWGNRLVPPERAWALSKYVMTVGVVALLSALFVAFFFWFLGVFAVSLPARWILTTLYALATAAFPYSTVFYSHQLAAGFLFVAFALLFLRRRGALGSWAAWAAGFLLGFALFTEYTVALIVIALGLYAIWILRSSRRELSLACLAGAVPVVGLLAYNYACFGGPLDTGYSHDFCWSAAQAAGYAGFTYPQLSPLIDLTFTSYRGLFFMSPFLLLCAPGAVRMWQAGFRLESALCTTVSILFILAISAYWGWNGGQVEGPRYLVPIIPFLALPIAFYLDRLRTFSIGWALVIVTGVWSLFAVWTQLLGGLLFPSSWLTNPIFQYSLPALARNEIAPDAGLFFGLSGWQSLLPLIAGLLVIALWPARPGRRALREVELLGGREPVG